MLDSQFTSLKEFHEHFKSEEYVPTVFLDNDAIVSYDGDARALEVHPDTALREALDILGIPWEHV